MRRLIAGILGVFVSVGLALPVSAQEAPATNVKLADIAIDHVGIVVVIVLGSIKQWLTPDCWFAVGSL